MSYEERVLDNRPLMAFALAAHAALFAAGESDRYTLSGAEHAVFAERGDGEVKGVILWEIDEEDGSAWVALVYVDEPYRREGLLRTLWEEMLVDLSAGGVREVRLGVMKDNEARFAYEKLGMRWKACVYVQSID